MFKEVEIGYQVIHEDPTIGAGNIVGIYPDKTVRINWFTHYETVSMGRAIILHENYLALSSHLSCWLKGIRRRSDEIQSSRHY